MQESHLFLELSELRGGALPEAIDRALQRARLEIEAGCFQLGACAVALKIAQPLPTVASRLPLYFFLEQP